MYPDNSNPVGARLFQDFINSTTVSKCCPLRVLELGCSTGYLGWTMRTRFQHLVWHGLDSNPEAIQISEQRLDKAFLVDLDTQLERHFLLNDQNFDLIIMCDVLEHLSNPSATLSTLRSYNSHACIIVVLPNIACFQIFDELSRCDFAYQDSGILDRTHITFFTPKSATRFFREQGYLCSDDSVLYLQDTQLNRFLSKQPDGSIVLDNGMLQLKINTQLDLNVFTSYGFGFLATPHP